MKPTAYWVFCLSVVLVVMAALLFQFPNPGASGNEGMQAGQWTLSALMLAGAIGAAGAGWFMLRYGGKGYTVTNSPPIRR